MKIPVVVVILLFINHRLTETAAESRMGTHQQVAQKCSKQMVSQGRCGSDRVFAAQ